MEEEDEEIKPVIKKKREQSGRGQAGVNQREKRGRETRGWTVCSHARSDTDREEEDSNSNKTGALSTAAFSPFASSLVAKYFKMLTYFDGVETFVQLSYESKHHISSAVSALQ